MARPAEVFVRTLRGRERRWLRSLRRRGGEFTSAVMARRAQVIDMCSRRYSAPDIADALDATSDWVRKVIHEFNDVGLEALVPAWGGGRPKTMTDEIRTRIVEVVASRPQELGEPYVTWSLSHLRTYLNRTGVIRAISRERLRVILHEAGHTTQSTNGGKHSPDPDFAAKAARLRRLYAAAESGRLGRVLSTAQSPPPPRAARAGGDEAGRGSSGPTTASPTGWRISSGSMTWGLTSSSGAVTSARGPIM
jgi:transposase